MVKRYLSSNSEGQVSGGKVDCGVLRRVCVCGQSLWPPVGGGGRAGRESQLPAWPPGGTNWFGDSAGERLWVGGVTCNPGGFAGEAGVVYFQEGGGGIDDPLQGLVVGGSAGAKPHADGRDAPWCLWRRTRLGGFQRGSGSKGGVA